MIAVPGKAILCGEYAVLWGAPAISTAVSRQVHADVVDGESESPFVRAALTYAREYIDSVGGRSNAKSVKIDSSALYENGTKLGLGSSAAVTVATVAALYRDAGLELSDKNQIFSLAHAAHSDAQGTRGSGVDVATSIWGGTIRFTPQKSGQPVIAPVTLPPALDVTFVFTGKSASTAAQVDKIEELAQRDSALHLRLISRLTELATMFSRALELSDVATMLRTTNEYSDGMAALGNAAGVDIVTSELKTIHEIARKHNGAGKPSGAGGGDLGITLSPHEKTDAMRAELTRAGLTPLTIGASAPGMRWETI